MNNFKLKSYHFDFNLKSFDKKILKASTLLKYKGESKKNELESKYKVKNINLEKDSIKYCSNLFSYLGIKKNIKILDIFTIEINEYIKAIKDYKLNEIELHIRNSFEDAIPPHQDQYYHYCYPRDKVKIIFSLTELSKENGFLEYLDHSDHILPLLDHQASSIKAFSSFIKDNNLFFMKNSWQEVSLKKNQIICHFMDSIHRASSNKTKYKSAFLVFRFDKNNKEIPSIKNKYKKTFSEYLSNIN